MKVIKKCNEPPITLIKNARIKYVPPHIVNAYVPNVQQIHSDLFNDYVSAFGIRADNVPNEVNFRIVTKELTTATNVVLKRVVIEGSVKRLKVVPELKLDALRGEVEITWKAEYDERVYDFIPSVDENLNKVLVLLVGFADESGTKMCCYNVKALNKKDLNEGTQRLKLSGIKGARTIAAYIFYLDNDDISLLKRLFSKDVTDETLTKFFVLGVWTDAIKGRLGGGHDIMDDTINKLSTLTFTLNKALKDLNVGASFIFEYEKAKEALEIINFIDEIWSRIKERSAVAIKTWRLFTFGFGSVINNNAIVSFPVSGTKVIFDLLNDAAVIRLIRNAYVNLFNVDANAETIIDHLNDEVQTPLGTLKVKDILIMSDEQFNLMIDFVARYISSYGLTRTDKKNVLELISKLVDNIKSVGINSYYALRANVLLEDGTIIVTFVPTTSNNVSLSILTEEVKEMMSTLPLGIKRITLVTPRVVIEESLTKVKAKVKKLDNGDYEVNLEDDLIEAVNDHAKKSIGTTVDELAKYLGVEAAYGIVLRTSVGYVLVNGNGKTVIVPKELVEMNAFNPSSTYVTVGAILSLIIKTDSVDPKIDVKLTKQNNDIIALTRFEDLGYVKVYGYNVNVYGIVKKGRKFYTVIISFEGDELGAITPEGPNSNVYAYAFMKTDNGSINKKLKIGEVRLVDNYYAFNVSEVLREIDSSAVPVIFFATASPLFAFNSSRSTRNDVFVNESIIPRVYRVLRTSDEEALPAYITVKGDDITFVITVKEEGVPVATIEKEVTLNGALTTVKLTWEERSDNYALEWDNKNKTLTLVVPEGRKGKISEVDVSLFSNGIPVNLYPSFSVYDFSDAINEAKDLLIKALKMGADAYEDVLTLVEIGKLKCDVCVVDEIGNKAKDIVFIMKKFGAFSDSEEEELFARQKELFIKTSQSYFSLKYEVLPALFLILFSKTGLNGQLDKDELVELLESVTVNVFDVETVLRLAPVISYMFTQLFAGSDVNLSIFGDVYDISQNIMLVNKVNSIKLANAPSRIFVRGMDDWLSLKLTKKQGKAVSFALTYEIAGEAYTKTIEFSEDSIDMKINLDTGALLAVISSFAPRVAMRIEKKIGGKSIKDVEVRSIIIKELWNGVKNGEIPLGNIITNRLLLSLLMGYVPTPESVTLTSNGYALFVPVLSVRNNNVTINSVPNTITVVQSVDGINASEDVLIYGQRPEEVKNEVVKKVRDMINDFINGTITRPSIYGIVYFNEPIKEESVLGWKEVVLVVPFKAVARVNTINIKEAFESGDLANEINGEKVITIFPNTTVMLNVQMLKLNEALLSSSPATLITLYYPITSSLAPVPLTWLSVKKAVIEDALGGLLIPLVGDSKGYIMYYYLASGGVAREKYEFVLNTPREITRTSLPEGSVYINSTSFGSAAVSLIINKVEGVLSELMNVKVEGKRVVSPGFVIYDYTMIRSINKRAATNGYSVSVTVGVDDGPETYAVPVLYVLSNRYVLPKDMPINIILDREGEALPVSVVNINVNTNQLSPVWSRVATTNIDEYEFTSYRAEYDIFINDNVMMPLVFVKNDVLKDKVAVAHIYGIGFEWLRHVKPTLKVIQFVPFDMGNRRARLVLSTEVVNNVVFSAIRDNVIIDFELVASNTLCNLNERSIVYGTLGKQGVTIQYEEDVSGGGKIIVDGLRKYKIDRNVFGQPSVPDAYYANIYIRTLRDGTWETYKVLTTNVVRLPTPIVKIDGPNPVKVKLDGKIVEGEEIEVEVKNFNVARKITVGVIDGFVVTKYGVVPSVRTKCLTPNAPRAKIRYVKSEKGLGLIIVGVCNTTLFAKEVVGDELKDLNKNAILVTDGINNVLTFINPNVAVVEYTPNSLARKLVESIVAVYNAIRKNAASINEVNKAFRDALASVSDVSSPDDVRDDVARELAEVLKVDVTAVKGLIYVAKRAQIPLPPINEYYMRAFVNSVKEGDGRGVGTEQLFMSVVPAVASVVVFDADFTERELQIVRALSVDTYIRAEVTGGEECVLTTKQFGMKTPFLPLLYDTSTSVANAVVRVTKNEPIGNAAVIGALLLASILLSK